MIPKRTLLLPILMLGVTCPCWPQVLTNTTNGTLNSVVAFGTLTPGSSNTPSTQQFQFRIRCKSNTGYHVSATLLSFNVVPIDPAQGGVTVSSSDVGIGITFVDTSASSVITPRLHPVANGFNYDPGGVTADIDNPVERPLPDARIVATDRFDTFSEVDGQFLLGDLPPGEYSFHLDPATIPANYQPKQSIVSIDLKPGESLTGIRFELVVPPKPVIMLN